MYAYDLVRYVHGKDPTSIRAFIDRLYSIQAGESSRRAVWSFLTEVGVYPLEVFNEAYYAERLKYEVGLLLAHSGLDEEASRLLSFLGVGAGGDVTFTDHVRQHEQLYEHQQVAVKRGIKAPLITSLPKSGSASLTQTLAKNLDAPVARLSVGWFPRFSLVEGWVGGWATGGMLNHDHFSASAHNLDVLRRLRISRVVVQVRDPRAATWSYLKMRRDQGEADGLGQTLEDLFSTIYRYNVQWLQDWLTAARTTSEITVHWVHFRDFRARPLHVIAEILEPLADTKTMRAVLNQCRQGEAPLVHANVNTGSDDAWRVHASVPLQQRMWELIPPDITTLLSLDQ
jgi:hypothetical protein